MEILDLILILAEALWKKFGKGRAVDAKLVDEIYSMENRVECKKKKGSMCSKM